MAALQEELASRELTFEREKKAKRPQSLFVEVTDEEAGKVQEYLSGQEIAYTSTPVSVPGMKTAKVHVEINCPEDLTDDQIAQIAADLQNITRRHRHRRWDDKFHTLGEEANGYMTGANLEEEERI
jgi:DNA-binding helix-hairpin-helix protein with protein kinase domain